MDNLALFRDRPTVLMVTSTYWKGLEYQDHHLARHFLEHGIPFVFIERSPQRWPHLGFSDLKQWIRGVGYDLIDEQKPIPEGIVVRTPRWTPPALWLRPINRALIQRDFSELKNTNTIIISYVPTYNTLDLIDLVRPKASAYICVHNYDDDVVMKDLLSAEKELTERCDALFADSEFLRQRLTKLSQGREIYPSLPGVSYQAFRAAHRGDEHIRPRKIYYFGGIGPHLDIKLYGEMASLGFEVVFVGYIDPLVKNLIPSNVEVRPPVANEDLPAALKEADILLLAYADSPYMRGVIPAKFFECLATGKPLLVSGLAETAEYDDVVYELNGSSRAALEIIRNLPSSETSQRLKKKDEIAKQADWSRRFESFVGNFDRAWSCKRA